MRRLRPVVREEEIDRSIEKILMTNAVAAAQLAETDDLPEDYEPLHPDIETLSRAFLRKAISEEIVPAVEAGPNDEIDPSDVRREVAKKALVGLHLDDLKRVARARALSVPSGLEALATEIAASLDWDETAIARLVLENEDEPSPERSHADRLFLLPAEPILNQVESDLDRMQGRYIRTGIARWFVFHSIERRDNVLQMHGSYRSYVASVSEGNEEPSISSAPTQREVRVTIDRGLIAEVRGQSATAARAAIDGLLSVTRISDSLQTPSLLHAISREGGDLPEDIQPSSAAMLDIITTRLATAGLAEANLTTARFQVGEIDGAGGIGLRPHLRAVRVEGQFLLDSAQVCRLISIDRRPLADLSVRLKFASSGLPSTYPVRIGFERDHAAVATGYGAAEPEVSGQIHRAVLDAVRAEMAAGIANLGRLRATVNKLKARGEAGVDAAEPSSFVSEE